MSEDLAKKITELLLSAKILEIFAKTKIKAPKAQKDLGLLNKALTRSRRLSGSKLVRSARPMTDFAEKVRKKLRKASKSETLKYRKKSVKGPQKALVTNSRAQAKRVYRK